MITPCQDRRHYSLNSLLFSQSCEYSIINAFKNKTRAIISYFKQFFQTFQTFSSKLCPTLCTSQQRNCAPSNFISYKLHQKQLCVSSRPENNGLLFTNFCAYSRGSGDTYDQKLMFRSYESLHRQNRKKTRNQN